MKISSKLLPSPPSMPTTYTAAVARQACRSTIGEALPSGGASRRRFVTLLLAATFLPTSVYGQGVGNAGVGGINVRDLGAKGNGVDDDQVPFERAVELAAASGARVFVPAGKYLLGSGGLKLQNVELEGEGGRDAVSPYGESGAVLITRQKTNPVIRLGRGGALNNLVFYYPEQTGEHIKVGADSTLTGAPLHYPPTIQTLHEKTGVSACYISRCTFINSVVAIELGDGTHAIGRVSINDCEACVIDAFLRINNSLGLVQLRNNFISLAVFQSVAITGKESLGRWIQQHAVFVELNECHGIQVSGGIVLGLRGGIHAKSGKLANSIVSSVTFDNVPEPIVIEPSVHANNLIVTDCTFYSSDKYAKDHDGPTVRLATAAKEAVIQLSNCIFQYSFGSCISIVSGGRLTVALSNIKITNWGVGKKATRKDAAIYVKGPDLQVMLSNSLIESNGKGDIGLLVDNADSIVMSSSVVRGTFHAVEIKATNRVALSGCVFANGKSKTAAEIKAHKVASVGNVSDQEIEISK